MRLAAMPAAELQETGRIPPNAHHSMPEDGCRPCSGLDPPKIKKVGAPCRRRPERKWTRHAGDARKERSVDPAVRVHDGAPCCACSRWSPAVVPAVVRAAARAETPCRHRGVKGQKVKVKAKEAGGASRQHLRQPQAEGRAQRVLGYFSRGQLPFPGQQGRRCTLRAARGARGG